MAVRERLSLISFFGFLFFISGCTATFDSIRSSQASLALESYQSVGMYLGQGKSLNFNPPSFSKTNQKSSSSEEMSFACHYDQAIDGVVSTSNDCNALANFSFTESSGQMQWTPDLSQEGAYEFQVSILFKKKKYDKIFEVNLKKQPLFSMNNDSGYEKGDAEIDIVFDNILNEGEKVTIYGDENCSQWLGEMVASSSAESFRKLQTKTLNYGTYKIHAKAQSGQAQFPCLDTGIDYDYTAPSLLVDVIPATSGDILIKENGEQIYLTNILDLFRKVGVDTIPSLDIPQYEYLDAQKIEENYGASVILKSSGKVVAYGEADFGGDASSVQSQLNSGVVDVISTGAKSLGIPFLIGLDPYAAYVALKEDGSIVCWGHAAYCDTTGVDFSSGVKEVYRSVGAFVAIKNNNDVVAWGEAAVGGDIGGVDLSGGVKSIISSGGAFAAIKNDDSVVCWGQNFAGGDCSSINFSTGVKKIVTNINGMAALKNNNDLVSWGSAAVPLESNVAKVVSNDATFAVLKLDGSAKSWGDSLEGGSLGVLDPVGVADIIAVNDGFILLMDDGNLKASTNVETHLNDAVGSEINSDIVSIQNNQQGAVFEKADGSILTYTRPTEIFYASAPPVSSIKIDNPKSVYKSSYGNFIVVDQENHTHRLGPFNLKDKLPIANYLNGGVKDVKVSWNVTNKSYAVLMESGEVIVVINNNTELFTPSELSSSVEKIYQTQAYSAGPGGFAALKADGSVFTWGYFVNEDTFSSFEAVSAGVGVEKIVSTTGAFAALLNDGSVVSWGNDIVGGDSAAISALDSGVDDIFSNDNAFAALKADGSVVTWGGSSTGGDSSSADFTGGVKNIFSTADNFAALKNDNSITSWGRYIGTPGNVSFNDVSAQLTNVSEVYSNYGAYFAVKSDGSLVAWGSVENGVDTSAVSGQLTSGVDKVYTFDGLFGGLGGALALKDNGQVIVWGDMPIADASSVASEISSGVVDIYTNGAVAVAKKADGSHVIWGKVSSEMVTELSESLAGKTIVDYNKNNDSSLVLQTTEGQAIFFSPSEQRVKYKQYLNSNVEQILDDFGLTIIKKQDGSVFIDSFIEFGLHGSFHVDLRAP